MVIYIMSPWISFVKAYAVEHKCSYKEALTLAGPEYKKHKAGL
jgi:hypothetical protein